MFQQMRKCIRSPEVRRRSVKRDQTALRLVFSMNIAYLVCWSPYGVLTIIHVLISQRYWKFFFVISWNGSKLKFKATWSIIIFYCLKRNRADALNATNLNCKAFRVHQSCTIHCFESTGNTNTSGMEEGRGLMEVL